MEDSIVFDRQDLLVLLCRYKAQRLLVLVRVAEEALTAAVGEAGHPMTPSFQCLREFIHSRLEVLLANGLVDVQPDRSTVAYFLTQKGYELKRAILRTNTSRGVRSQKPQPMYRQEDDE